ncbi:MAG: hypothetical protein IMW89_12530, partial [Ktedonobacteraceae bacterium]|nr:hypothetical protein [Ktedonobacteraceae bacterium]
MGSEYMGPFPPSDSMQKQHNTQKDASSVVLPPAEQSQSPQVSQASDKDELHPGLPATPLPQRGYGGTMPQATTGEPLNGEPVYREHASVPLPPPYPVYYYQPTVPSQPPGQGYTTPAGQQNQGQGQQVPPQYGPYPGYSWGYYGQPHAYNGYGYPPYAYPYQYPYQY